MSGEKNVIGIDVGSIAVSLAELNTKGNVLKTAYSFHNGNTVETLTHLLKGFNPTAIDGMAATSSTPDILNNACKYDSRVSYITAARHLNSRTGSILIVGGEKFGVALFDNQGEYLNYKSNSSCAAGTGSFLDQQAKRLNLGGIEEFSELSSRNTGEIPKIASRCAVFAKTDLIHAQQEGYSLEAICEGLSYGLAKNIIDTLFKNNPPSVPLIFAGGVSKNRAVVRHLSEMLGVKINVDAHSHVYGAIGAALNLLEDRSRSIDKAEFVFNTVDDIIAVKEKEKRFEHSPLTLQLSDYPDFESLRNYSFESNKFKLMTLVETDIYMDVSGVKSVPVFMGVDIGSTSTKAVLMNGEKDVIAGFYTRTSGRPVEAVQLIFEAIEDFKNAEGLSFEFVGVGSTGSGRKFIGEIIGSDIALDEITAHARAATELNYDVDTIIEIGGQDSKFTTLRNGMVTFSIMNNVCAAGTGSFIEEQAKKLNCPLEQYSARAENVVSPISSDKCTVFMERDLNHYLSEGYSVEEALASALHSVRDNYLTKVAIEKNIGDTIFFQGATAKNKALVAAFEQKLKKPIMVSKFCHLTGALGVALHLHDHQKLPSKFRGIDLYKEKIPVSSEVCELCTNHCKIKTAVVNGETVAYGFLCGRDYETRKYIKENQSGFALIKVRKKAFAFETSKDLKDDVVVGIPAALHIFEDLNLWKKFFDLLSIKTVSSETFKDGVKEGKKLAGAEFCAPVFSLHGHVKFLSEKVDYVFLPDYFEEKCQQSKGRRHYCYYTQYAPALISKIAEIEKNVKILNPILRTTRGIFHTKVQLYKMLRRISGLNISFLKVSSAYDKAQNHQIASINRLKNIYKEEKELSDDINVVLLGRPYSILSPSMNNHIPEIFNKLGVKTFFQDMLSYDRNEIDAIDPLLEFVHWHYASKIFEAAEVIASTKGMYPVLVTSFKCTSDAYAIDFFKNILDSRKKPYLILQLDEHDSSVGYETRIEAGVRAFRNHYSRKDISIVNNDNFINPVFLNGNHALKGKTLLLPNYDEITCKLIEAVLRREGVDARLMKETDDSIRRSMSLNNGQCLPASMMSQTAIDYIERHDLDPAKTAVWSIGSNISCNLGTIAHSIKTMMESYGKGMEKVEMYRGEISYADISFIAAFHAFFGFMFGGMLKKMGCMIRPYEDTKGSTDRAISKALEIFYDSFLHDTSKETALQAVIKLFKEISVTKTTRPKVAIFGDIYVRDNDVANQNLIKTIEDNGGEALTTPYSEYMKIIVDSFIKKWMREGFYANAATAHILKKTVPILEKKYYAYFNKIINEPLHKPLASAENVLSKFNIKALHAGESLEIILEIFTLINNYSDIALFVQTSPALCCPSLVTEAMSDQIEAMTGIPIVTIEYDGTGGFKNDDIIPYLKYAGIPGMLTKKRAQ